MPEPTATTDTSPSTNGKRPPAAPPSPSIAEQTSPSTPAQQFLCPYCGHISESPTRCDHCKGLFEPLSRQATQNHMGPWQLRDHKNPFQPGCSFATLKQLIARGKVTRNTIIRGPTTRQFWSFACNAPGVAVLLGECHSCHAKVKADEYMCANCNAVLSPPTDRQHLGLSPVKLLPGQASPEAVASSSMAAPSAEHGAHHRHHASSSSPGPATRPPAPRRSPARQAARSAKAPTPRATQRTAPEAGRETVRRLRERVRFMTGALVFAAVLIVAMMALFAATMLADSSSLRFGRPAPAKPEPSTQPAAQPATPPSESDASAKPDATESAIGPTQEIESDAPASHPPATSGVAGSVPGSPASQPALSTQGLDPALGPWKADIEQAADLEKKDTVEDLESAVAILQRVLKEATSTSVDAGEPAPTFPLLQARIDRLTERIDRLKLRDAFN